MSDSDNDRLSSRIGTRFGRIAANIGLVITALVIVEAGSFVTFKVLGLQRFHRPVVENPHHPYLGWIHHPNITIEARNCGGPTSVLQTDAEGYSVTPHYAFATPTIRVAMTGGSTVFGVGSSTNDHTVASLLEQMLVDELKVDAEVYNLGVRGYQSFQEMLALRRFATAHDFDLAIALSGRNDAYRGALEQNLQSALLPGNPHRTSEFLRRVERGDLIITGIVPALRSCCYAFDLLAQIVGADQDWRLALGRRRSSEQRPRLDEFPDVPKRAEITLGNYALMNTIAAQQGARFVMMLQPTLYTKAVVATEEQECSEANSIDPVGLYHKKFEQMFYRNFLDMAKPFAFVDATKALDGGTERDVYYVDRAHYNDRGAAILAAFLFNQIRPIVEEIAHRAKDGSTSTDGGVPASGAPIIDGEDWLAGRRS